MQNTQDLFCLADGDLVPSVVPRPLQTGEGVQSLVVGCKHEVMFELHVTGSYHMK